MANLPERRRTAAWSPMRELQRQVDRLFESFAEPFGSHESGQGIWSQGFQPACDVEDKGDHYLLSLDLPGVRKEDVKIDLGPDNTLMISGERKSEREEERKGRRIVERSYGSFDRSFSLPPGVDADRIQAAYENGVLEVWVPKPQGSRSRQIEIGERREAA